MTEKLRRAVCVFALLLPVPVFGQAWWQRGSAPSARQQRVPRSVPVSAQGQGVSGNAWWDRGQPSLAPVGSAPRPSTPIPFQRTRGQNSSSLVNSSQRETPTPWWEKPSPQGASVRRNQSGTNSLSPLNTRQRRVPSRSQGPQVVGQAQDWPIGRAQVQYGKRPTSDGGVKDTPLTKGRSWWEQGETTQPLVPSPERLKPKSVKDNGVWWK